jgi:branched-chain amino acid transport system permease protein
VARRLAAAKPQYPTPPWAQRYPRLAALQLFFQDLVNGILAGGILAVAALGFSLVWGILNIINLAHGTFIMLGAYITWQLFTSFHLDPFLSVPIAFALMYVFGYALQRGLINQVVRAPILATFLLTFGLSLLAWSTSRCSSGPAIRARSRRPIPGANFTLGGVTVPWTKLATLGAALLITA